MEVANLTDKCGEWTKEDLEKINLNSAHYGTYKSRTGISPATKYYGFRTVSTPEFKDVAQVLVLAFEELVWINIDLANTTFSDVPPRASK